MIVTLARNEPVARKTHACWVCGPKAIQPGDGTPDKYATALTDLQEGK